jgi:hypothetical protein
VKDEKRWREERRMEREGGGGGGGGGRWLDGWMKGRIEGGGGISHLEVSLERVM